MGFILDEIGENVVLYPVVVYIGGADKGLVQKVMFVIAKDMLNTPNGTTNAAASEQPYGENQQKSLIDQDGISDVLIPSASQIDKRILCHLPEPLQGKISQKLALTLQSSEPTCQHKVRQSEVNRTPQQFIEGVQDRSVTNAPCPGWRQTQTSGVNYENSILLPSPSQIDQEQ
eukprot:11882595-Ditylum_brightwellii.AAC.1